MSGAQLDVAGDIEFDEGKATLHSSHPTQDTLVGILKTLQYYESITRVRIEGHTDSNGDANENQRLSEARANTVMRWLIAQHISATRLTAVGCAARDPLAPNTTPEGKQKNRRTEFDIETIDDKPPADYTAPCAPNPKRKQR